MGSEFQVVCAGAPPERTGTPAPDKNGATGQAYASQEVKTFKESIGEEAVVVEDQAMMQEQDWKAPGFGPLTRVTTNFGEVPAQALRVRDMVRTQSGQFLPIVWLDRLLLNEDFLLRHPEAMPIEIHAGAFGPGKPERSVILSPGQSVCPEPGFGTPQLVKVADMLHRPGALRKPEQIYTYTMFHLGQPALVRSEGLWIYLDPKMQDIAAG